MREDDVIDTCMHACTPVMTADDTTSTRRRPGTRRVCWLLLDYYHHNQVLFWWSRTFSEENTGNMPRHGHVHDWLVKEWTS